MMSSAGKGNEWTPWRSLWLAESPRYWQRREQKCRELANRKRRRWFKRGYVTMPPAREITIRMPPYSEAFDAALAGYLVK